MKPHLLISSLSTLSGRCVLAAIMVMLGLIWALPVYAAGPVVDTAVDENDGSCSDGDCSLRDAIATTNPGDTITFASDYSIYLNSQLSINKTVTVDGSGQDITVSGDSGNNGDRNVGVFYIGSSGVVTLTNLNIVSGTTDYGGGIYNYYGILTINNSTLSDNQANRHGGGIYNYGTVTINDSTLSNNQANSNYRDGGGIYNRGTMTINNSTLSDNQANDYGGGIFNDDGPVTINNSTLSNNQANDRGGGIYHHSGTMIINHSTFSDNQANSNGGGISINDGTVTINNSTLSNNQANSGGGIFKSGTAIINNSTLSDNQADFFGGGIYNITGTFTINNSTLSNNQANSEGGGGIYNHSGTMTINHSTISNNQANSGGGIYNDYDVWGIGILHLHNTIIANSIGGDCHNGSTIATNAYNLIEDGSCNELDSGSPTGFVTGDPNLGPLQDNGGSTFTHALLGGSPAVDAGSCSGTTTDQRGFTRPVDIVTVPNADDGCDIGAYESSFQQNQAPFTPSNPVPPDDSEDISITQTLSWQGGDPDGDVVVTYTVAFGTDNPPSVVGTTTQTSYVPLLITGTTYYWVITANDGVSESVGPLWTFTTEATTSPETNPVYLPIVLK